ncbi:uncharacterized protein PV06_03775 [Exophiala oligosperma]|uniref:Carboxylic ester hydrolase n=2 Tax=Chaetothyriales TaxID=34395 RepID=A0A0D2EBL5_9EURO|nr:uncharacterized protein PV06_03775 [Exophiala oligosperma]KAJ9641752.1 hypothetical protein H2204_002814 [Knufia peltigerae]KIW45379.1 hypothetical protein PV06_03775 [Exophiala oligosperma]
MKSFVGFVAIAAICALSADAAAIVTSAAPSVTIDSGPVVGTTTSPPGASATVDKYLGIPFAASPVRFAPATKPTPWREPFQATKYGPACIQQFPYPEASRNLSIAWFNTPPPPAGESEDCLNVNVYVPGTPGSNKTVMAWIYGGSLRMGANSLVEYDGSILAANQDVIVVSLNYRTNVFGFPNSPEIPLTERNLAFLDQRFALEWIQRNIAAFGGDPKKVTIFGESAGGGSVDVLVTTMKENPPFRAAIIESGQATSYVNTTNAPTAWLALAAALNCTTTHPKSNLTCLRNQTAETIKSVIEHRALAFRPVADNVTVLRYPEDARLNRSVAHVPILAGTNANEGTIFTVGQTNASAFLATNLPNQPKVNSEILQSYPGNSSQQVPEIWTEFGTQCQVGILTNDSHTAGFPTWRYFYNATFPNINLTDLPHAGVFHSSEISLIYGTYPQEGATAEEKSFSLFMQGAWAGFAKHPYRGPGWKPVPAIGELGTNGINLTETTAAELDRRCDFFLEAFEAAGIAPSNRTTSS